MEQIHSPRALGAMLVTGSKSELIGFCRWCDRNGEFDYDMSKKALRQAAWTMINGTFETEEDGDEFLAGIIESL